MVFRASPARHALDATGVQRACFGVLVDVSERAQMNQQGRGAVGGQASGNSADEKLTAPTM